MGIATWMMGKMMDKFLALPPEKKAEVIGTMSEKFWAAATPQETARVAEILLPRFVDAFLKGASDAKKQEVFRAMVSPELVQKMMTEAAPAAVSAAMSSALPGAAASALSSALPAALSSAMSSALPVALASQLPAAVQGMLPQMMEAWLRGMGDQQKKDLFGGLMPAGMPTPPKPPRPPQGGMMGGFMGGQGWG
jgi:hypothetical protein